MKLCPKCGEELKENAFHERYCRNGCEIVTAAVRGQQCFTEVLVGDPDKPYSGSFGQAIRRFPTNREWEMSRRLGPRPETEYEQRQRAMQIAAVLIAATQPRKEPEMSWSVTAVGKPAKVAESVAKQIAAVKCSEPEETIKNRLGTAIAAALAAFPPGTAAEVKASGSQYAPDARKPDEKQNTFSVSVTPIYGFIE